MMVLETRTALPAAEVIARARRFFVRGSPCPAFPERSGEGFLRLHLEVGEIVIGAVESGGATLVRGSASRGAPLLTRFLTTLAPALDVRQTTHRTGRSVARGALVKNYTRELAGSPAEPRRSRRAA